MDKNEENDKIFSTKNPHTNPYRIYIMVIMEILRGKYFSLFSFLSIETLIKWLYFVDDPLVKCFSFSSFLSVLTLIKWSYFVDGT